jgi:phosphoglycolate phosphatase
MIGDREHDVLAGRACGTASIGVLWGAGDRSELEAAGADRIVAEVPELAESVRTLRTG